MADLIVDNILTRWRDTIERRRKKDVTLQGSPFEEELNAVLEYIDRLNTHVEPERHVLGVGCPIIAVQQASHDGMHAVGIEMAITGAQSAPLDIIHGQFPGIWKLILERPE